MSDGNLSEFIHSLPKTETHLHFEGALPWALLQSLYPEKYKEPPESWAPDFRFSDFASFERELVSYALDWFDSPDRYYESAKHVFAGHLDRNVKYVETSFSSGCLEIMDLNGPEVLSAIRSAVPYGLEVRIFMGIHHSGYSQKGAPILEDALSWDGLAGIDLHGTEDEPLGDWAKGYYKRARDAGKFTKAHAGELCGPDFVRFVIEELGVQRVEHGVRAYEDPALVKLIKERNIALDMCPVSNVKLGVADSFRTHPIRGLLDAGVVCTLSTDDPVSFGNMIDDEYRLLAEEADFTRKELAEIAANGFRIALIDDTSRQLWLNELDEIIAKCA